MNRMSYNKSSLASLPTTPSPRLIVHSSAAHSHSTAYHHGHGSSRRTHSPQRGTMATTRDRTPHSPPGEPPPTAAWTAAARTVANYTHAVPADVVPARTTTSDRIPLSPLPCHLRIDQPSNPSSSPFPLHSPCTLDYRFRRSRARRSPIWLAACLLPQLAGDEGAPAHAEEVRDRVAHGRR